MALPTTHIGSTPTVYQAFQQYPGDGLHQVLTQGLKVHAEKTLRELEQLCSLGHSQNYFIFENMVNYNHQNPHFKNGPRPLLSLLKISVFANHMLLQSLGLYQQRASIQSLSKGEQEMISRLGAHWSLGYFDQFRQRRMRLLKEVKTVSRSHHRQVSLMRKRTAIEGRRWMP